MASFQKTQYIDVLGVKKIYAKGDNNQNIGAARILTADGIGGTSWEDNIALSSVSIVLNNISTINTNLSYNISTFNSPFSTFIYTAISSFSTALYTNTQNSINTRTLNISTLNMAGTRQPFIQYGSANLSGGLVLVTLPTSYINTNYAIQLTYIKNTTAPVVPISFSTVTSSNFQVYGDAATRFYWTTYGNTF